MYARGGQYISGGGDGRGRGRIEEGGRWMEKKLVSKLSPKQREIIKGIQGESESIMQEEKTT